MIARAARVAVVTASVVVLASPTATRAVPLGTQPIRVRAHDAASATVVAAGDISCDPTNALFNSGRGTATWCRAAATEKVIARADPDAVLTLGDNQYDDGRLRAYQRAYGRSWGTERYRTYPVIGNHDYESGPRAHGYFHYFGARAGVAGRGWYSTRVGSWRLIALNTNCAYVSCGPHGAQYAWLSKVLTTRPVACTIAIMHHPLVSSGPHGDDESGARALWKLLYRRGVDVALTGHDHIYERFKPVDAFGQPDVATGIREFVVGTGGAQHYWIDAVHRGSQVRNTKTFGVLRLALHPGSYTWRFLPIAGATFTDIGSASCHGAPA